MRILIIRLSSIGDIILTTPILKKIKAKYPKAQIDFLVLDKFKDAILGNPNIDNVILFEKGKDDGLKNIRNFAISLKKNSYTKVYDLHSKIRSKLITYFLGVKSETYKKRSFHKTMLVKLGLTKYKVDNTIVKNYFGAFKGMTLNYTGEDLEFNYGKEDLEKVKKYKGHIVLAPGASKNTKKWTKEGFGKLSELIYIKTGKKPILIGGINERVECEKIKEESGDRAINLAGELTLKESGALLDLATLVVTNDSGPFHIARGVKTRSYVIFGPTDPGMFEYNENEKLIYGNENCSPCSLHGDKKCPNGHFNCMKNISGESVFKMIEKDLEKQ